MFVYIENIHFFIYAIKINKYISNNTIYGLCKVNLYIVVYFKFALYVLKNRSSQ